nr:unknown [Kibdelosporangium sp. MJ126-NF4]CTQ96617.1 unknown [Kibdelosporangium sp. MJ126-NF4]
MSRRALLGAGAVLTASGSFPIPVFASETEMPADPYLPTAAHAIEAETFAQYLNLPACPPENNNYKDNGTPNILTWGEPGKPSTWFNQSQCASFLTGLLRRTYPAVATDEHFETSFGSRSPNARQYRQTFAGPAIPHWQPVRKLTNLRAGDFIAIDYANGQPTQTGHIVMVRRIKGTYVAPNSSLNFPGETQYAVEIVDCTSDPHGVRGVGNYAAYPDIRLIDGENDREGVGFGHMMFYASNSTDVFTRYRWSVNTSSSGTYTIAQRPIAAARFSD